MKIRSSLILLVLSILFFSCGGGLSQEGTGSVTMDAGRIAQHLARSAGIKARDVGSTFDGHGRDMDLGSLYSLSMTVKLSTIGDYSASAQEKYKITMEEMAASDDAMESFFKTSLGKPITIEEIPIGSRIKVKAEVSFGQEFDEDAYRKILKDSGMPDAYINEALEGMKREVSSNMATAEGYSQEFTVKSGTNNVTIRMAGADFENIGDFGDEDADTVVLYVWVEGAYNFYLRNMKTLEDIETPDFVVPSWESNFCFDANGYIYIYGNEKIYTNNPALVSPITDATAFSGINGIVIDTEENVLYLYQKNEMTLELYKCPDLISSGSTSNKKSYYINFDTGSFYHEKIVINDSTLYDLCSSEGNYSIATVYLGDDGDIRSFNDSVSLDISSIDGISQTATITDMLYQEGAVYLLLKEYNVGTTPYYSRGAVLRYSISSGAIDRLGLADHLDNNSFAGAKLSTYVVSDNTYIPLYNDAACTSQWYIDAAASWHCTDYNIDMKMLDVYAPDSLSSLSKNQFYGPSKFVAVKPKKLVIADDGIAFYTDNDILKYKNVNRIVTVALDRFAIVDTKDTSVAFDSDRSDMIVIGNTGTTEYKESVADEVSQDKKKYYGSGESDFLTSVSEGKSINFAIPCGD